MKLLFLLFLLTFSVHSFSNDNPAIAKAEYVGDLTWEYKNYRIRQGDITNTKKHWIFKTVNPVWGYLSISYIIPPKNEEFEITTRDFNKKEKKDTSSVSGWYNKSKSKPFATSTKHALKILKEEELLTFYVVNWEKTKEYKEWESQVAKNKVAWDKYNQLSNREKRAVKNPEYRHRLDKSKPIQFRYVIKETFKIIIPVTEKSERDYWAKTEKVKNQENLKNFGYFILILVILYVVWFILKISYRATKRTASKIGKGYGNLKDKQYKNKVRKLAEVTAMTEIIKEEIKSSTPDELSQLKKQIAEAIESGDNEKADSLLNIAERLKKLND